MIRVLTALCLVACARPPGPECEPPGVHGLVASTLTQTFDAGTLTVVDLDDGTVCDGVTAATGDTVVRATQDRIVQIDRLRHDNLRILDPADWRVPIAEFSVGEASNPQDVVTCGERLLVSLYESDQLGVFDLEGRRTASVDLSAFADADGLPEAADLRSDGTTAWVALQRLTRRVGGFDPIEDGRIVEIECETFTVTDSWPAPPNARLVSGPQGLVTFGASGEIRPTGPGSDDAPALARTEQPISGLALGEDGNGLILTRDAGLWYRLDCLAPDGAVSPLLATNAYLPAVVIGPRGEGWVAVRPGWADPATAPSGVPVLVDPPPGLWRVDPKACALLDDDPVVTALAPFSLALFEPR